ncbi:MAG: hypothetical protein JWM95_4261 [Gemmatimonadetes bacterium]|nr:hypothetical protein [Gemmatimonadota bacterium]
MLYSLPAFILLAGAAAFIRHDQTLLHRTQRAVLTSRFTAGRLDGIAWNACTLSDSSGAIRRSGCNAPLVAGSPGALAFSRIAEAVSAASVSDSSSATLRATALVELRSAYASTSALDRAVHLLQRAQAATPRDVGLLNDLGVAFLAVAERDQQLLPAITALDVVDRALREDSTYAPALFNRALILERLYLPTAAGIAWQRYLAHEPNSAWHAEASAYAGRKSSMTDSASARQYPQHAREALFVDVGALGGMLLRNDRGGSRNWLVRARLVSDSLLQLGADATVASSVHWLTAMMDGPREKQHDIARALVNFSVGVSLHDAGTNEPADSVLRIAERELHSLRSPLALWASFYRGAVEANMNHFEAADSVLSRVVRSTPPREPALEGKARWVRGVIQMRQGNYEVANREYETARALFVRAMDAKNEAATAFLLSESLELAGQSAAGQTQAFRGLKDLAPFRRSPYLHNQLITVAGMARTHGLTFAALEIMSEAMSIDRELGRASSLTLALWTRARDYAASGDSAHAFVDLDSAALAARGITGRNRQRANADIAATRASLLRSHDPHAAMALITNAVTQYRDLHAGARLPSALFELATLARDVGDTASARASLLEAIDRIESQNIAFTSAEARASFSETVERVFDAMIGLELETGHAEAAFRYLERERATAWTRGSAATPTIAGDSLSAAGRSLQHDGMLVAYAVLPDRVAIWSVSPQGVQVWAVPVGRAALSSLAGAIHARDSTASLARARLFQMLLAPLLRAHPGVRQLSIVPDRELLGVPFATLLDRSTGRYLVEDYVIRTLPSVAFVRAAASARRPDDAPSSALIVDSPALSPLAEPMLGALPGADVEAKQIAALYHFPRVLDGARATRKSVISALAKYPVVHFAGHAVFNADRPELSYLALAADGSADSRLMAREISTLRLSNVRLVVLSACSTLNPRPTRAGSVAGLAFSFLRAGSPATVSTLWDVRDGDVGDVLVGFHTQIARGAEAAEALRAAQVSALRSERVAVRSPEVWGAFIYTGP